jgi:hypothetical protein
LSSLSLKINYKLDGINHRLVNAFSGAKEHTMIVGADVTHSTKASVAPSVAGVVATCDGESNQYLASARLQLNKTEVCFCQTETV